MEAKTNEKLIREEKNRYHREWYARNKNKVKAANLRYWQKKLASQQSGEVIDDGHKD